MKYLTKIGCILAVLLWICPQYAAAESSGPWQAWLVPASLNKTDRTLRLIGGRTQMLSLMLDADKAVKDRGDAHIITLTLDLPAGMNVQDTQGVFKILKQESASTGSRIKAILQMEVKNGDLVGPRSEWQTQQFFVTVPQSVASDQAYVELTLADEANAQSWRWPLEVESFQPAQERPKRITLGLWDYNYRMAQGREASEGIASFLADAGIGYVEDSGGEVLTAAYKKHGILVGGNTHHDYFYSSQSPEVGPAGNVGSGGFPSAEGIIELPPGAAIPGVAELVKRAKAGDGVATFDYEPGGWSGFGPKAVARFQKEYGVSDDDFKTFREYVAQHGDQSFKATDPLIAKIWRQWTAFCSEQARGYMKRIYEAFKAEYPQGRLAVTPSMSVGADSAGTLAFGCDNSAIATYTDIIMPQIYLGYGGAPAKAAMYMTEQWRRTMTQRGDKSSLWPLLLVRYSGASVCNPPERVRQQVLGSLAHGADGVVFYFPGMMDGPYWQMVARTAEEVARYEDFYLDGKRVEKEFALEGMPLGCAEVISWPGYKTRVDNPQWAYTAHELNGKVLLTLINLEESNDLIFQVKHGDLKVLESRSASSEAPDQWLVGPRDVGFVVLEERQGS